jgi:hypothetical protein
LRQNFWIPERDATLLGPKRTASEVAAEIGTTRNTVVGRYLRPQPSTWTREQDAMLLQLWPTLSASQIAAKVGKSRGAVIGRYHRLRGNGEQYAQRRRAKKDAKRQAKQQVVVNAIHELKRNLAQGMDRNAAIQIAIAAGASQRKIAEVVGVSYQRISQIRTQRNKMSAIPLAA